MRHRPPGIGPNELLLLWGIGSEISIIFSSVSVDGPPDLIESHEIGYSKFLIQVGHRITVCLLRLQKLFLELSLYIF